MTDFDTIRRITRYGTNWVTQLLQYRDGIFEIDAIARDPAGRVYLAASMSNGLLLGEPTFKLGYQSYGDRLVLSWPTISTNFLLETTPSLAGVPWVPWTNDISMVGENYVVTNILDAPEGYFRLRKP